MARVFGGHSHPADGWPYRRRHAMSLISTLLIGALLAIVLSAAPQPRERLAEAADARDFQAGYLISDENFFNGSAMDGSAVQSFLNAKVAACRSGYTCLKDYRQDTPSRSGETGRCAPYSGALGETAARIIAKVGVACGVSQKAILVLLEKEQGLVTDTWPTSRQYRSATGYGCPDTADCDAEYYGFFNQVWMAALQFKRYAANPTNWNHLAGQWNYIRYSPDSSCGSSAVYIRNQATAGLYNYTPYQPNAAALANLYGTGDACSAYGNRNFWRIYSDWFGSPIEGPETYIERTYQSYGGSSGPLGSPVTSVRRFDANGGGWVRGYQYGAIAYSEGRGAYALMGEIRAAYGAQGGVEGWLGWPASPPNTIVANGGGAVQAFQNGAIASSATGTWTISGPIRTALNGAGGIGGEPGWPSGAQQCSAASVCRQPYLGGTIYQNGGTAYFVPAAIRDVYEASGAQGGSFGRPIGASAVISQNGGGRVQAFEGGAIAASPAGAFAVTGAIRTQLGAYGGIAGPVGWPVSAAVCGADGSCIQRFQGGTFYVSAQSWFIDVRIDAVYGPSGGPAGALGKPTSGLIVSVANGGGVLQSFERGAIVWSSDGGTQSIVGGLRAYFNSIGGIAGAPGWPKGAMSCTDSGCIQSFTGGVVLWSDDRGGAFVPGAIGARYLDAGGPAGSMGWPITAVITITANGGGKVQGFERAGVASSASGTFALSGQLRTYYNSLGGVSGSLGWPMSEMTCTADGICTQRFQGGTLSWSPLTGGTGG